MLTVCCGCAHSPVAGHSPRLVPVVSAFSEMRCGHSLVGAHMPWMSGWPGGEETGGIASGEFPKVSPRVFFFWGKSSCSILHLPPYKEGPVLSHSPPLQLDWGLSGSASHTAQLSTLPSQRLQSPWVYHFILIPLPVTSSN